MSDDLDDFDYGEDDCWNCGGSGFVSNCFEDACMYPDEGCDECTRACDVCRPRPITPEDEALREVLREALANTQTVAGLTDQSRATATAYGAGASSDPGEPKNDLVERLSRIIADETGGVVRIVDIAEAAQALTNLQADKAVLHLSLASLGVEFAALKTERDNQAEHIKTLEEALGRAADIRWDELANGWPVTMIDREMLHEMREEALSALGGDHAG